MLDPWDPRMSLFTLRTEANTFNATQQLKSRIIQRLRRELTTADHQGETALIHGLQLAIKIVEES